MIPFYGKNLLCAKIGCEITIVQKISITICTEFNGANI